MVRCVVYCWAVFVCRLKACAALCRAGTHPELLHLHTELSSRRDKRLELAARRRDYEVANVAKRRRLDEAASLELEPPRSLPAAVHLHTPQAYYLACASTHPVLSLDEAPRPRSLAPRSQSTPTDMQLSFVLAALTALSGALVRAEKHTIRFENK